MKAMNLLLAAAIVLLVTPAAEAQGGGTATARLRSFEEVPAVSAPGANGRFDATLNEDETEIHYTLQYSNISNSITQSHIHFAQRGVNGGIVIFLCSNLGNGPADTQQCPQGDQTIEGTITADNVGGGAAAQGIAAGQFGEVIRAMRNSATYVNLHTDVFPSGQIRGQLHFTPAD